MVYLTSTYSNATNIEQSLKLLYKKAIRGTVKLMLFYYFEKIKLWKQVPFMMKLGFSFCGLSNWDISSNLCDLNFYGDFSFLCEKGEEW